ncbi:hypothetical protein K491DRAFT_775008 [Lophiostoma macrostomum CBS 122681]|uniref:Uncharacterized protein n=1 Tax=Lophiostoma macrostomum CBS 122681 TaxID=1314788 RepID=A0A6A6TIZ4_9PLEO|nr:hypothetical protein K491DRAFT_775008 [Lophiostoma macrostomum CBS 122681]
MALSDDLLEAHHVRTRRSHQAITGGQLLNAISPPDWDNQETIEQLHDFNPKDYTRPYTAVFYCDGSHKQWYLASSIVWLGPPETTHTWNNRSRWFGSNTGQTADAELAGIDLALDEAVRQILNGYRIDRVAVFCDNKAVVDMLENGVGPQGRNAFLGPITEDGVWPLQSLYRNADWLIQNDVPYTIYWMLGHSDNLGNDEADWVVKAQNDAQIYNSGPVDVNRHVRVPEHLLRLDSRNGNSDLENEYLHRKSAPWFRSGLGLCHERSPPSPRRQPSSRRQSYSNGRRRTDSRTPTSRRLLDSYRPTYG